MASSAPARIALGAVVLLALLVAAGTFALLRGREATEPLPADAGQVHRAVNLMVVGDDAVVAGISRKSPVFERALLAFENELRGGGFEIHDGRAVSTINEALDGVRRSDAEIILLARQRRALLDAIVVFSVVVPIESTMNAQIASIGAAAKVLRVADGRNLGSFAWTSSLRWSLAYACDRTCVVETAGTEAHVVAVTVGEGVLAILNDHIGRPPGLE